MRYFFNITILVLASLFYSCSRNPLDIDVSEIKIENLKSFRLDQDMTKLSSANFKSESDKLKMKYGKLYDHYLASFICKGTEDSAYQSLVSNFLSDKDILNCQKQIQKIYTDDKINKLNDELNLCTKRFKYYFPEKSLPKRIVTCQSGWNYAFAYYDSSLIVALDMYLGDTSLFYQMLRYPQYQIRKMNEHHLLSDIIRGWLLSEFDKTEAQQNLLNHTVFYGKLFFAVNALLPSSADSLIIGYSTQQMNYCKQFEKQLWGFFASKNRLYDNNLNTIRELTTDGPFTGAIHKDCPPRIAMWVGWQIVKSYMKNNENISLVELMNEPDAQKILSKSKYRP